MAEFSVTGHSEYTRLKCLNYGLVTLHGPEPVLGPNGMHVHMESTVCCGNVHTGWRQEQVIFQWPGPILFPIVPVPFSVPPTVLFPYNVNKPLGRVWLPTIRNKVAETEEISSRRFVPVSFRTMEDRFWLHIFFGLKYRALESYICVDIQSSKTKPVYEQFVLCISESKETLKS